MTTQAKKVKPDNLMGATEVAEYLEVSRQRVLELRQKKEDFPRPVAELKSGPVWDRAAIDEFVGHWERKPGRPRKDPLGTSVTMPSVKEEQQYDPTTSIGNEPEEVVESNPELEPGLEPPNEPAPAEDPQEPVQQPQEQPEPETPAPVDNPQVPQQPSADQIDLFEETRQEPLHSDN
jgi:hypothetical protein